MKKIYSMDFFGRDLTVETGWLAKQANGSVLVRYGDTVVLSVAVMGKNVITQVFFPLQVLYLEKLYSVGKIPVGFIKREGRPTDEATFNRLQSLEKEGIIGVYTCQGTLFSKYKMPKFSPNWGDYKLSNLPQLTPQTLDIIEETAKKVIENKDNFFLINNLKPLYNMPLALSQKLGKTVLSINTHILLEHLLQVMTHSSAIIDNTYTDAYLVNYAQFCKGLIFQGKHKRKDIVIEEALKELQMHAIIDDFDIIDDSLVFESALITKHIKQRIRRNMGFYAPLPPTKQAPIIATFINYLAWISDCPSNFTHLTIALDTLLAQLGVQRLLEEHRLSEIAKLLNLLRSYGVQYGLLCMPANAEEITSTDVKYLLANRTELHKYIVINNPKMGKEKK